MKRRLLASVLAAAMAVTSFTTVSFAEEADDAEVVVTDEVVSDDAAATSQDSSEDTDEAVDADVQDAQEADLAFAENLTWILGSTRTVKTSCATVTSDADGNPSKIVMDTAGTGKFSASDEEHLYYVSEISKDENFTLEADMNIDGLFTNGTSSYTQSTAGIIFMSNPYSDAYSASQAADRHEKGLALRIWADKSSSGGFSSRVLDVSPSATADNPTKAASEATLNKFADIPSLTNGGENLGTYHLAIIKSGNTYLFKVVDGAGNVYRDYATTSDLMFDSTIYPGFFAARDVAVTFDNISLTVDPNVYTAIRVTNPPNKTVYSSGEAVDITGMVVEADYNNPITGESGTRVLTEDEYAVSGFVSDAVGKYEMYVVKGDVSTTVAYTIRGKLVTKVEITEAPIKNEYYEYQYFDKSGLEGKFTFEDGTTQAFSDLVEITDDDGNVINAAPNYKIYINGVEADSNTYFTASQAGKKTVSIGYNGDLTNTIEENNARANFGITVYPHKLKEITVATLPTKRNYVIGEEFLSSGMTVTGYYYEEGNSVPVVDFISGSDYTITGFDSSKVAEALPMTVTLNANKDYTTTFNISIGSKRPFELIVTQYPRTTYVNGTDIAEIEAALLDRTQISICYNDGTMERKYNTIVVKDNVPLTEVSKGQAVDAVIDASAIDPKTNGEYLVTVGKPSEELIAATGISANSEFDTLSDVEFYVTIANDTTHYWRRTIFGQSSGSSTWTNVTSPDSTGFSSEVRLRSWNGAGKITTGGNDGIVYYYTRFDPANNFTLKGDVYVNDYLPTTDDPTKTRDQARSAQEGFGIQFRDTISLMYDTSKTIDSADSANNSTTLVSQIKYAQIDSDGEPVPCTNNSTQEYSNMVLAGTFTAGSYPTESAKGSSSYYFNTHKQRINMYIRTGVVESYSTNQTALVNYGPYCLYGTTGDEDTGLFFPKTGDIYTITLSRINGGYFEECTIKAVGEDNAQFSDWVGKTFTYSWYWGDEDIESDPLLDTDDTVIYAGFCAARWADVNVSNISWYDSDPATDMSYKAEDDDLKSPTVTIVSPLYTSSTNYKLMVKVNTELGGIATIKLNDKVIANGIPLNKRTTTLDVTLNPESEHKLTIIFTPDKNDTLSSYDDVIVNEIITCVSSIYSDTEDLYVAPDVAYDGYTGPIGSPAGTGERESPLNLDSALGLVNFGQKIIVMDGTYYRTSSVEIAESNYGLKGQMKYLWAEEGAHPVFDLQGKAEGLHMNGDWWWVKGLSFTNSGDNNKGGGLAASDCILDNCKFYDNGTTGLQVSGSGSNKFEDQPARNLVVYCEVWNNHDSSMNNADGFGCKLTVGNGNMFKNCVSHHNLDDGWDFYTKTIQGYIGATILEDCISYKCTYYLNADGTDTQYQKGSGNGFKMGGDSMYGQHYLKDCIAFQNLKAGFDSNANPAMKLRNCVAFDNNANFGITTGLEVSKYRYNYNADGCVSYYKNRSTTDSIGTVNKDTDKISLTDADGNVVKVSVKDENGNDTGEVTEIKVPKYPNAAETDTLISGLLEQYPEAEEAIMLYSNSINHLIDLMKTALSTDAAKEAIIDLIITPENVPLVSDTNYWALTSGKSTNASGEVVTDDFFESVNVNDMVVDGHIAQNEDGSYIRNGFLVLKGEHAYKYREDGLDIPNYPAVYYIKFPDGEHQPSPVGLEDETEATTKTPTHSSGGGGGGGSSSRATTTTEAATEATTKAPVSTTPGDNKPATDKTENDTPAVKGFTDIAHREWAVEAINALNDKGIVTGVTSSTFVPDNNVTRADFCVMISRAAGYDGLGTKEAVFSDVDANKYYANYVAYAAENGYVTGYDDGEFKPNNYITRQEMMVVVAKILGADGTTDTAILANFADGSAVAAWAAPYVAYLAGEGIVSGTDTGINPTANITRAQAVVLIYNALDKIEAAKKA